MNRNLMALGTAVLAFALGGVSHSLITKRIKQPTETIEQRKVHRCTEPYYNQAENYGSFDAYCFGLQAKLYHEAWAGNVDVMKLALRDGASADSYSEQFLPPLLIAARNGHTEAVRLLLDNGADVDREWVVGSTPLMSAVLGGHTDTANLLISRGANVNVRTHEGRSAIEVAREEKLLDIAALLQRAGAK